MVLEKWKAKWLVIFKICCASELWISIGFSDVVHGIYIIFALKKEKVTHTHTSKASSKSTISDGDCGNIADFPVLDPSKESQQYNIWKCKEEDGKTKRRMKNSARNQYMKWISFYRRYKNGEFTRMAIRKKVTEKAHKHIIQSMGNGLLVSYDGHFISLLFLIFICIAILCCFFFLFILFGVVIRIHHKVENYGFLWCF